MEPVSTLTALLTSAPVLAAYGPWGVAALLMGWMLWRWLYDRTDRLERLRIEAQAALREDQRELFERQGKEVEGLRVDVATLQARLRAMESLANELRVRMFDYYGFWRDAHHAAMSARQAAISAGIAQIADYEPLKRPEPPTGIF